MPVPFKAGEGGGCQVHTLESPCDGTEMAIPIDRQEAEAPRDAGLAGGLVEDPGVP